MGKKRKKLVKRATIRKAIYDLSVATAASLLAYWLIRLLSE